MCCQLAVQLNLHHRISLFFGLAEINKHKVVTVWVRVLLLNDFYTRDKTNEYTTAGL